MDQIQDLHQGHQVRYIQAAGLLIGMKRNARGVMVFIEILGDEPGTQRGRSYLLHTEH
ncbi:hypothetical protein [Peribacillus phoenicis]|uniref:hypothetical protein n=1 Tax=unclassified Peribacillus TaxID=2675266 RepID=UPI0039A25C92